MSVNAIDDYVIRWSMDGPIETISAGSTIIAESGDNFNGTIAKSSRRLHGMTGNALALDGENNYIDLPNMDINYSQGFSYTGWVYYNGFGNYSRLFDFGNGPENNNILLANEGTSKNLTLHIYSTNQQSVITAPNVLEAGKWVHIAATVDASGNAVLYKNGEAIKKGIVHRIPNVTRSRNYIGKSNWGSDAYLHANLDEIAIYKRALSQQEIRQTLQLTWDDIHSVTFKYPESISDCSPHLVCSLYLTATGKSAVTFKPYGLFRGIDDDLTQTEWRIKFENVSSQYFSMENVRYRRFLAADNTSKGVKLIQSSDANSSLPNTAYWRIEVAGPQNDFILINKVNDQADNTRQYLVINQRNLGSSSSAAGLKEATDTDNFNHNILFSVDSRYVGLNIHAKDVVNQNSRLHLLNGLVVNKLFTPTPNDSYPAAITRRFKFTFEDQHKYKVRRFFASHLSFDPLGSDLTPEEDRIVDNLQTQIYNLMVRLQNKKIMTDYSIIQVIRNILLQLSNAYKGDGDYSNGLLWFYDDQHPVAVFDESEQVSLSSSVENEGSNIKIMTTVMDRNKTKDHFGILIKEVDEYGDVKFIVDDPTRTSGPKPN